MASHWRRGTVAAGETLQLLHITLSHYGLFVCSIYLSFKEVIHPKMEILFPQVVPVYEILSSVKHKRRYMEEHVAGSNRLP